MNHKANVQDSIPILFALFGIFLVSLLVYMVVSVVNDDFQADATLPQEARNIMGRAATEFPQVADFFFMLMFIGLPLVSAVLAYFDNVHPFFFWVSLLFVIVVVLYGASISELYNDIIEDSELATYAADLPMSSYVLANYGSYSLLVFVIIAAGTFFKLRGSQRDLYGGFQ